jgi:hypothetical protein
MNRARRTVRVTSAVFAVLCVVVAAIGLTLTDEPSEFHKITGVVGQTIDIEGVELTVLDVTVGQVLGDNDGTPLVRSPGLFVGIDVLIACPGARGNPASTVRLHAGERTYEEWIGSVLRPAAGFQSTSRVIFEVDPADLGRLVADTSTFEIISGYQAHGWIDLGLAATADRLRAEAADRMVTKINSTEKPLT